MLSKFKKCSIQEEEEDKPLLKLMQKLINLDDNKQKRVITEIQLIDAQLSNAELLSILKKDLNLNTLPLHPYEVHVYLYMLKTFLKVWPDWDRVAQAAIKYKRNPRFDIDSILIRKYEDFKEYLKGMLELNEPIRKKNFAKLIALFPQPEYSIMNAVLKITCSLNKLNLTQPHPKQADTIINIDEETSKIQTQVYKLEELLYWPKLRFHVTIGPYEFVRKNKMRFKHNYTDTEPPKIRTGVYKYISNTSLVGISLEQIKTIEYFNLLKNKLPKGTLHRTFISSLLESIVRDLTLGPKCIDQGNEYKYYPSRDAYVRYVTTDDELDAPLPTSMEKDCDKSMLIVGEIMTPSVTFKIKRNKIDMTINEVLKSISNATEAWIQVECVDCKTKFVGLHSMIDLKNHIMDKHDNEPDIQCMGCQKEFSMRLMASHCWKHKCNKDKNHGSKNRGGKNNKAKKNEAKHRGAKKN